MVHAATGSTGDPTRGPRRTRRRTTALVTAAAAGAALLTGAAQLHAAAGPAADPAGDHAAGQASVRLAGGSADDVVLDRGPTTDLTGCVDDRFATDPATVEVLYGVRQATPTGEARVLVVRNAVGRVRLCDMLGTDAPSVVPGTLPTTDRPVEQLSNGRRAWDCRGGAVHRLRTSQWLSVLGSVAVVRTRFVVGGRPQPWFVTRPADGIAHLQAWLDGPLRGHQRLAVQEQVLDAAGRPVRQTAVPTGRQPLTGCADGSAMIG